MGDKAESMTTPTAPNWDALAPYWHCFETYGLNRTILSLLLSLSTPPILYVGGGRGAYPARLESHVGRRRLLVVDASWPMARRARADFGLEYIVADVRNLPRPDLSASSVICATGVLEYMSHANCVAALSEMGRICVRGGAILITAFASAPGTQPEESGRVKAVTQPGVDIHRRLEKWFYHYETLPLSERRLVLPYNAVARQLGDRAAAYRLLRESLPRYEQPMDPARFARLIEEAGLIVKSEQYVEERGVAIWHLITG
jgi:ubiquinone/menaquinone biosynthesis C-methylase UbiE